MRRVSMATRDELVAAVIERYSKGRRAEKGRILDEFVAVTGFHRKHAMRVLRGGQATRRSAPRPERRGADRDLGGVGPGLRQAPESAGACSRGGDGAPRASPARARGPHGPADDERGDHGPGSPCGASAGRRRDPAADGSVLGGPSQRSGAHLRGLARSAAGFCRSGLGGAQRPLGERQLCADAGFYRHCDGMDRVQAVAGPGAGPAERGFDGAAQAAALRPARVRHGQRQRVHQRDHTGLLPGGRIAFTRCRPYRKNDQAFVEQKNGAVVRRIVGYRRLEGWAAAGALARLYATTRLFVNVFQPSIKLAGKEREGARVRKRYHPPATPCERLLADPRTPEAVRSRVEVLRASLDPVGLLTEMRAAQRALVAIADQGIEAPTPVDAPSIEAFLAGFRTAWREGEVRPTAQPKPKQKRGRRRPDPLIAVTTELRAWFDADPSRTGRELLERLQAEHPERDPDRLLRTLQRRLKVWRGEMAQTLVFGIAGPPEPGPMPSMVTVPA